MLGTISTVTAIALAYGMAKPTTKDDGWNLHKIPPSLFVEDKASTDQMILGKAAYISSTTATQYSASTHARNKIESLKAELATYGSVLHGWDGEGSEPPNSTHISAASQILSLLPAGVPIPVPMLSADGEVGLYWKTSDYLADAVIEDAHHFSLFIRSLNDGNLETSISSIAIGEGAPAAIAAAFKAA